MRVPRNGRGHVVRRRQPRAAEASPGPGTPPLVATRLTDSGQNGSAYANRTRFDVRVAPHSSLLIGVHDKAAPRLAAQVRQ